MSFGKMMNVLKDILFPVFCLQCGVEGEWVCGKCTSDIVVSGVFFCPVCHAAQSSGVCCSSCEKSSYLSSHVALTPYREDLLIGKLIRALKYQYAEDVFSALHPLILNFLHTELSMFQSIDVIIPVPLHKKRLAERGFNQADMIAEEVGKVLSKPVKHWIQRERNTPHQALLSRQERLKNVVDAFVVVKNVNVSGQRILLVDDIFTTGCTLQECAKALRATGAREVRSFSIARG